MTLQAAQAGEVAATRLAARVGLERAAQVVVVEHGQVHRDVLSQRVAALRQAQHVDRLAAATPGADFTFVLRNGEFHDWAIVTLLPETAELLPDMYRQLGIGAEVVTTLGTCDVVGVPAGACEIAATS